MLQNDHRQLLSELKAWKTKIEGQLHDISEQLGERERVHSPSTSTCALALDGNGRIAQTFNRSEEPRGRTRNTFRRSPEPREHRQQEDSPSTSNCAYALDGNGRNFKALSAQGDFRDMSEIASPIKAGQA